MSSPSHLHAVNVIKWDVGSPVVGTVKEYSQEASVHQLA